MREATTLVAGTKINIGCDGDGTVSLARWPPWSTHNDEILLIEDTFSSNDLSVLQCTRPPYTKLVLAPLCPGGLVSRSV